MEIVLNVRSENLDNNLTAVDSNFSKPNYYGISISVLKPCVDNRDAARKQKNKITYFKQKRNIETGKEIKKLVFSK